MNAELCMLMPPAQGLSRRRGLDAWTRALFCRKHLSFSVLVSIHRKSGLVSVGSKAGLSKTWKDLGKSQVYGEHHEDR